MVSLCLCFSSVLYPASQWTLFSDWSVENEQTSSDCPALLAPGQYVMGETNRVLALAGKYAFAQKSTLMMTLEPETSINMLSPGTVLPIMLAVKPSKGEQEGGLGDPCFLAHFSLCKQEGTTF